MVWLWTVLISIFSIAAYLLLAPFYLEIDSRSGLYRIRFHRLASVRFSIVNSSLIMDVQVTGWHKRIDLSAIKPKEKKVEEVSVPQVKRKMNISFQRIWGVLRSFKVNKCRIAVDFGDMALDGILYPLFYWVRVWSKKDIGINFSGENELVLEIENNFIRMLWAYVKS